MVRGFKQARDGNGSFSVDWSMLEHGHGDAPPARIEFIPFGKGDARVPSIPADETMYCGVGNEHGLTHAVIALRVGSRAVHVAMTAATMRQFANCLLGVADMIDAGKGSR